MNQPNPSGVTLMPWTYVYKHSYMGAPCWNAHSHYNGHDASEAMPLYWGADVDTIAAERDQLKAQRDGLLAGLEEALEYFEDREDVVDGSYGEPAPNKEMQLAQTLRNLITEASK